MCANNKWVCGNEKIVMKWCVHVEDIDERGFLYFSYHLAHQDTKHFRSRISITEAT